MNSFPKKFAASRVVQAARNALPPDLLAKSGRAVVVLVPSGDQLTVAVGCLHRFIGLTVVPADTREFPNEGVYNWGQVICVQDGRLKGASFRHALEEMQKRIGEREDA